MEVIGWFASKQASKQARSRTKLALRASPFMQQYMSGVQPLVLCAEISAPYHHSRQHRSVRRSELNCCAVRSQSCRASAPRGDRLGEVTWASSSSMIAPCPPAAASCSGVFALDLRQFGSTPSTSKYCTTCVCPAAAARCCSGSGGSVRKSIQQDKARAPWGAWTCRSPGAGTRRRRRTRAAAAAPYTPQRRHRLRRLPPQWRQPPAAAARRARPPPRRATRACLAWPPPSSTAASLGCG